MKHLEMHKSESRKNFLEVKNKNLGEKKKNIKKKKFQKMKVA